MKAKLYRYRTNFARKAEGQQVETCMKGLKAWVIMQRVPPATRLARSASPRCFDSAFCIAVVPDFPVKTAQNQKFQLMANSKQCSLPWTATYRSERSVIDGHVKNTDKSPLEENPMREYFH